VFQHTKAARLWLALKLQPCLAFGPQPAILSGLALNSSAVLSGPAHRTNLGVSRQYCPLGPPFRLRYRLYQPFRSWYRPYQLSGCVSNGPPMFYSLVLSGPALRFKTVFSQDQLLYPKSTFRAEPSPPGHSEKQPQGTRKEYPTEGTRSSTPRASCPPLV